MTEQALVRAMSAWAAADKRRALDPVILDVSKLTIVCDYFVICGGRSLTHVASLAEGVEEDLERDGSIPRRRNAPPDAKWVVLDYGDVVVHILTEEARSYYNLEALWSRAELVPMATVGAEADPAATLAR